MHNRMSRALVKVAVVAMTGLTLTAVTPDVAHARNDCDSDKKKYGRTALPDLYSVTARCADINANKKARGGLDVTADIDVYTQWFTAKNRTYESSSKRAFVRGTYVRIQDV